MRPLVLTAALALGACATQRAEQAPGKPELKIAGGQAISGGMGGVRPYAGTPVAVQLQFKDGSPGCVMQGAVQSARDAYHRWVWLEPTEGCPEWLYGRWWAELRTAASGWILANISQTPVESQ